MAELTAPLDHDGVAFLCPTCQAHTAKHCTSPTCTWWACNDKKACRTYGDARRYERKPA